MVEVHVNRHGALRRAVGYVAPVLAAMRASLGTPMVATAPSGRVGAHSSPTIRRVTDGINRWAPLVAGPVPQQMLFAPGVLSMFCLAKIALSGLRVVPRIFLKSQ
jgi:hypothetical protein